MINLIEKDSINGGHNNLFLLPRLFRISYAKKYTVIQLSCQSQTHSEEVEIYFMSNGDCNEILINKDNYCLRLLESSIPHDDIFGSIIIR